MHHIIVRGIERRWIFSDDQDRDNFVKRLGDIVTETQTVCFGWAFIPNHAHILLRTDQTLLATVMRRLLTGYAVSYSRHRRHGHLFQNRYKSILCQEDSYLLELVRYIHLNPLRAKIVKRIKMSLALTDRVCVVTGSAKSIGLGIAEMYCREGAAVALIDIDPQVMEQSVRLNTAGYNTKALVTDITNQPAVFECFQEIENALGPVYALANVAGYVDQQKIEDVTPERIDKVMQINVNGTVYCIQGTLKSMRTLKNGRIINFSFKSGKTGSALMAAYSGAKGAIIAITHSLAFELAPDNIKVNCLCPGITGDTGVWDSVSKGYTKELSMPMEAVVEKFTDKIPLQRLANIEDIVAYTRFLTVHGDYCTGQALNITGGREVH